jgi:hypothetical protein
MKKREHQEKEPKNNEGREILLDETVADKRSNSFPDDDDELVASTDENKEAKAQTINYTTRKLFALVFCNSSLSCNVTSCATW